MRKSLATVIFVFFIGVVFSQERRNSVYVEGGGNTVYYSINYDRIFALSNRLKLAPRAGFMYLPLTEIADRTDFGDIRIPFEANLLWSNSETPKNYVEAGIGMSLISLKQYVTNLQTGQNAVRNTFGNITTMRVGLRHQKSNGGLMYRIGLLVPITQDSYSKSRVGDDIFYRIYGGASLGYSF